MLEAPFVGRANELHAIEAHLRQRRPLFIRGLHGIGKTSLVKQALAGVPPEKTWLIDFQSESASLREILERLDAVDDDPIVVLDELEALPLRHEALRFLGLIPHRYRTLFIVRDDWQMLEATKDSSPRLWFLDSICLQGLDPESTDRLAQLYLRAGGLHEDDVLELAAVVGPLSGGHPFLIKAAARVLLDAAVGERNHEFLFPRLRERARPYLVSAWQALDHHTQEALCEQCARVLSGKAASTTSEPLSELKRLGLLNADGRPFSPVLVAWLAHLTPKDPSTLSSRATAALGWLNQAASTTEGVLKLLQTFGIAP